MFGWLAGIIGGLIIFHAVINLLLWLVQHMSPVNIGKMPRQSLKDIMIECAIGILIVGIFLSGNWIRVANALIQFGNGVASNLNGKVGW
ncbi:hypothetical protein CEB3_c18590 [Peptococcaceae bacterium CEB3]|nr:hypothetical protein CEB3_c18590 [Peptococcaceae bacterium CEB3]